MAVLTKTGRAALADAIKKQALHLAWGEGLATWDSAQSEDATFDVNDQLTLAYAHASEVVVTTTDEVTTFVDGTDYTVDAVAGKIYRLVTGSIGSEATVKIAYNADTPPASVNQSTLIAEVGRREIDEVEFAVEDSEGVITAPTGRFTISATPTNHLFVRTRFDFGDAAANTIREQALFVGTETDGGLPVGQKYFVGGEVTDPGIMLMVQNSPALIRQPTSRETYEFVVSF